jgi:hypothetical protein
MSEQAVDWQLHMPINTINTRSNNNSNNNSNSNGNNIAHLL